MHASRVIWSEVCLLNILIRVEEFEPNRDSVTKELSDFEGSDLGFKYMGIPIGLGHIGTPIFFEKFGPPIRPYLQPTYRP